MNPMAMSNCMMNTWSVAIAQKPAPGIEKLAARFAFHGRGAGSMLVVRPIRPIVEGGRFGLARESIEWFADGHFQPARSQSFSRLRNDFFLPSWSLTVARTLTTLMPVLNVASFLGPAKPAAVYSKDCRRDAEFASGEMHGGLHFYDAHHMQQVNLFDPNSLDV